MAASPTRALATTICLLGCVANTRIVCGLLFTWDYAAAIAVSVVQLLPLLYAVGRYEADSNLSAERPRV